MMQLTGVKVITVLPPSPVLVLVSLVSKPLLHISAVNNIEIMKVLKIFFNIFYTLYTLYLVIGTWCEIFWDITLGKTSLNTQLFLFNLNLYLSYEFLKLLKHKLWLP
jgi:hypothetical protein